MKVLHIEEIEFLWGSCSLDPYCEAGRGYVTEVCSSEWELVDGRPDG